MDLCQVQIWHATSTLRGHPEPHAGSWLGGKTTDTKFVSLSFKLLTGVPASQRKRQIFNDCSGPLVKVHRQLLKHTMKAQLSCCQLFLFTKPGTMKRFWHRALDVFIYTLPFLFSRGLNKHQCDPICGEVAVIMPRSFSVQLHFANLGSLFDEPCSWLMCFLEGMRKCEKLITMLLNIITQLDSMLMSLKVPF